VITERHYIKDTLYDFFLELLTAQGVTDIPLIYDNENGLRLNTPFLMLSFRSTVNLGMPDYSAVSLTDGTKTQRLSQHTRQNMTMYGFGERAVGALETIKSQLNADIWVDKLRKRNLVIPRTMETLESPRAFETSWERGASFYFDLTYIRVIETDPGYIEDVGLNPGFIR
jgi:hypothetical protein